MGKFPTDAPRQRVLKALGLLGFELVREGNHIAMRKALPDGTAVPLTLPNHRLIKQSTLRTIRRQAGIERDEFLDAYAQT